MTVLGAGWLGFQFFWGFHTGSIPLFLNDFTDSKLMISLVLSLAGLAGCTVPPIVGYLSDRTMGRFGRRRPYILFGIAGVSLCVLIMPHTSVFGLVALLAGLTYFSLRTAETPYLSLLPDITPPHQRSTASGLMNLFGSIGLISYFIISSFIWDEHRVAVFTMVALLLFTAIMITLVIVREPQAPERRPQAKLGILGYIKDVANETNVLKFFIAQFLWWFGFWMVSSFATLFVVEVLHTSQGESLKVMQVFAIVATVFMLPLGMLGDRFGRKQIISCAIAVWAVSEVLVGLSQTLNHALLTVGFTAIPFAAVMGVGLAYFLDLIPHDRTAEFVGLSIISVAGAQMLGPVLGGVLIDFVGYRSIFPTCAAFMIAGLIVLQFVRPRPPDEEAVAAGASSAQPDGN
jgi:MFS family permease